MKYLITGGCGFLGCNLALETLNQSEELIIFDNLSRFGASENLKWLNSHGTFNFVHGDIRNCNDVDRLIKDYKPEVIFHLAGQVAMTTSIQNPRLDFEINALGSLNLLEAVRKYKSSAAIIYSSTNKVYGDLEYINYEELDSRYKTLEYENGFDESLSLQFSSPYGCSKGSADQYMLDYAKLYGLNTVVFRHSSIFGGRQYSTADQGWLGWFVQQALETKKDKTKKFTISGNGKQVRDVLFITDLIKCYFQCIDSIHQTRGHAFNIGGGIQNSLSLLELFAFLESELDTRLNYTLLPWRQSDQKVFVANTKKALELFSWKPRFDKFSGIKQMLDWVQSYAL